MFSDAIVLGTVVTHNILYRNMKILYLHDIEVGEGEGGGLEISHEGDYLNYYLMLIIFCSSLINCRNKFYS